MNKGTIEGLGSGITWAIDTVILSIALSATALNTPDMLILVPFLSCFMHDVYGALVVNSYGWAHGVKLWDLVRTKVGHWLILAAIIGGPVGMASYCYSVYLIGPVLTALVAAMTPVCTALLAYWFLKYELTSKTVICVVLSSIGLLLLGMAPDDTVRHGSLAFGLFIATLVPISWAAEIVIADYALNTLNADNDIRCIQIRETASVIVYGLVVLPALGGLSKMSMILGTGTLIHFAVAGALGGLSYILYYRAIGEIGSVKANLLNTSYSPLTIILASVVSWTMPPTVVLLSTALIIGAALYLNSKG